MSKSQRSVGSSSRNRSSHGRSLTQPSMRSYTQRSQRHVDEDEIDLKEEIMILIKYLVSIGGGVGHFKKGDVMKHCLPNAGPHFDKILLEATKVLNKVYGYNILSTSTNPKTYFVTNALEHVEYEEKEDDIPKDANNVLLLLILSHIFMSNNECSEDLENRHPVFGVVKDYIKKTLVTQKYLSTTTDNITKKMTFTWGERSQKEISKPKVLEFVCKIYQDRTPKSWTNQFKDADNQKLDTEIVSLRNNERMDQE